jgi:hypothetical protein
MIKVVPRRIIGPFPDGQYMVVLEDDQKAFVSMLCNKPYDDMISSSSKICAVGGWLFIGSTTGIIGECRVVDREGIMSFMTLGEKSVYDYGAGLAIHGCLQHGTSLLIDDSFTGQMGVKERLDKLEQEVGSLHPLPKLESTSQLRAACEFLRL